MTTSSNGPMRMAGHVSAYCARCRRDVVVPENTMRCPYGNHDVEGTSLPRTVKVEPPDAVAASPEAVTVPVESPPAPAPAAEQPAPKPASPATDRVTLPDWMKEGKAWLAATEKFAAALAAEDKSLSADVRQIRGVRKLLDAVLDKIEPTPGGDS